MPASPTTCTAWVWQPNGDTWCWLVTSGGRIVADHETGECAQERAKSGIEAAAAKLSCSSTQTLLLTPWEVPHA